MQPGNSQNRPVSPAERLRLPNSAPAASGTKPLLSPLIRSLADNSPFFIAPLVMDKKCLGLFYADRADSQRPLTKEDFSSFTHFVRQASLCLLLVMKSQ